MEFAFEKMLNPLYGYEAVQDQMKSSFSKTKPSMLLLQDFFVTRSYESLKKMFALCETRSISRPDHTSVRSLELPQTLRSLFVSPAFYEFVRTATGIRVKDVRLNALLFGHRDFTLLHDDVPAGERFMFVYMMVPSSWQSSWGGSLFFSYGDDRDPFIFEPKGNVFVLLKTVKGLRDFIKYVNHRAGNESVIYLFGEFLTR